MPKINQEEYEVLKEVRKDMNGRWHWLAKNEEGVLRAYNTKPERKAKYGSWGNPPMWRFKHNDNLFQFIQWEDEEPYNIAELIEEYEYSAEHVTHVVNERVKALGKAWSESGETEMKDIEWLKEEIQRLPVKYYGFSILKDKDEYMVDKDEVIRLINQLVPKQEEVDQAYKSGYETGKQHTFYKGYLEGLADKEKESETVADVVSTFWKSYERLKEVMSMEVEELEE